MSEPSTNLSSPAIGSSGEVGGSEGLSGALRLWPSQRLPALRAGGLAIVGVVALILFLDGLAFRSALPASYVSLFAEPNQPAHTTALMIKALVEEVAYRLVMMTLLVVAFGGIWRNAHGRIPAWVYVAAILISQTVGVSIYLATLTTNQTLAWGLLRFLIPGWVWGWLYWRHGWVTGAASHALSHLLIDPLLTALLRH